MRAHLPPRDQRILAVNRNRLARRFSKKLRLATPVHSYEPPNRFVHSLAHGEQSMIPQNRRLARTQSAGDTFTFARVVHHAGKVIKHRMVFKKSASVLRDG